MGENRFLIRNPLGSTGMQVSRIGFGAWGIGGKAYGALEEKKAEECLETYFGCDGNFVDTARMYDDSEAVVGRVLKRLQNRDKVILCSKSMSGGAKEEMPGFRRDIETGLKLLGTDYIDVYYLHNPPVEHDEIMRMLEVLAEYKQKGIIRAIGASIKGVNVTDQTVELCHTYIETGMVDVLMLAYSIFRQKAAQVFDTCADKGIGVVVRSVLESGFLTGNYEKGHVFASSDHRSRWSQEALDEMFEEAGELKKTVVNQPYENLSQVAIQFALSARGVSCGIVGATTSEHVLRNTKLDELPPLPGETLELLRKRFDGKTERYNAGVWNYGGYIQTGMK